MTSRLPDGTTVELVDGEGRVLAVVELRWHARRGVERGAELVAEDIYEGVLRPQAEWTISEARRLIDAAWESANEGSFAVHEQLQEELRAKLSLRRAEGGQPLEFITLDGDDASLVLVLSTVSYHLAPH